VTIVRDDGTHEVRDVTVGVTDRVNAAILSGLNEGEKVVAGMQTAERGEVDASGSSNGRASAPVLEASGERVRTSHGPARGRRPRR
jgi:macrolide-specific efflux system membrane fusion protein